MYGVVAEDSFNGGIKLDAEQVVSLAEMRAQQARALKLYRQYYALNETVLQELATIITPYKTEVGLPLVIEYRNAQAKAQLKSNWLIRPEDELIETLNALEWQAEVVMK